MVRATRGRRSTPGPTTIALREELAAERAMSALLRESLSSLEQQIGSDPGWRRMVAAADEEFSAEGLRQIRAVCRLYAIKNPLVRRGVHLRAAYVWGQGVQISARATGRAVDVGEQDVNAVISQFLDLRSNRRSFTGLQAMERLERSLATDGEIPVLLHTDRRTGRVLVRTCDPDEIVDIRTNPDDAGEPWYYLRRWSHDVYDPSGGLSTITDECWYPHVDHRPKAMIPAIAGTPVMWDSPLLHIVVNGRPSWQRGVPDAYAAVDWARAYKEFLEDWARLMKSLSRYAWRAKAPASQRAAVRSALSAAPSLDPVTGEPNMVGSTVRLNPDAQLEAISKSGATIDSDSGRPLATMVASALDLPVTMLLADPGQTGARATADTLDRPTELGMQLRQKLWSETYRRICEYVIAESVRAPGGKLTGTITLDGSDEIVILDGDTDTTIDIVWPDLDELDPSVLVKAVVDASTTGTVPPELVLRLLLGALGVGDVDGIIESMLDEDGRFMWPDTPGGSPSPGGLAVDALASGADPAATGDGPMTDDQEDGVVP